MKEVVADPGNRHLPRRGGHGDDGPCGERPKALAGSKLGGGGVVVGGTKALAEDKGGGVGKEVPGWCRC